MAAACDNLKELVAWLVDSPHDVPYRTGGYIIDLQIIWEKHPELRDECQEDWLAAIEWCREDPACQDEKYFPEWKVWVNYFL